MPTISIFFGIVVQMYWNEHNPPHFHCRYGEYQAVIAIESLQLIEGELPPKALSLVLEWAHLHQDELRRDWVLCQTKQAPQPIPPLE